MDNYIFSVLKAESIEYFGIIPFSLCKVINRPLLDRTTGGIIPKSVIMLLIPYFSGDYLCRNISLYAIPRDYHLYFKQLYSRIIPKLSEHYPKASFFGFADHSPIGETGAAALAGLGLIGDKFQLINEKYGSYTFIGEIITDLEFDSYSTHDIKSCNHCGKCSDACPTNGDCLSDLTQRKGELTPTASELIRKTGIAWGCDICRTACPLNIGVAETPIEFFKENLTPHISSEQLIAMPKEDFSERAYSWRGRNTILRNLLALEDK